MTKHRKAIERGRELITQMCTKRTNCVTHTDEPVPFEDQDGPTIDLWIAQAQAMIGRMGWTYTEFDYAELVYCTAIFLYKTSHLRRTERTYPHYVVHCHDDDSRFETPSHGIAMGHFKRLQLDGKRGAVFHWLSSLDHKRLYASEGYPYSRDFGPQ